MKQSQGTAVTRIVPAGPSACGFLTELLSPFAYIHYVHRAGSDETLPWVFF